MALGSQIIQKKFQFSDRELVEQLTENPYLQYFIGLPGYQDESPSDPSTLVLFRKRLDVDAIMDANAYMFDSRKDNNHTPPSGPSSDDPSPAPDKADPGTKENRGTLIVDATCALVNIRYPQDISLLNEAREQLKTTIFRFCKAYALTLPRRYVRKAWKDYLAYAKCGSIPGSRQGRKSKSSFLMSAVTWSIWTALCRRDTLL